MANSFALPKNAASRTALNAGFRRTVRSSVGSKEPSSLLSFGMLRDEDQVGRVIKGLLAPFSDEPFSQTSDAPRPPLSVVFSFAPPCLQLFNTLVFSPVRCHSLAWR